VPFFSFRIINTQQIDNRYYEVIYQQRVMVFYDAWNLTPGPEQGLFETEPAYQVTPR